MTDENENWRKDFNKMRAHLELSRDRVFNYFSPFHDDQARKDIKEMAASVGVVIDDQRILEMDQEFVARTGSGVGSASESLEGINHIILDERLNKVQGKAVSGHEIGHLLNKDAHVYNPTTEQALESERRADWVAANLCQGRQNAAFLKQNADNGSGATHPAVAERIATFTANAEIMEKIGKCKPISLEEQQEAGAPTTSVRPLSRSMRTLGE